MQTDSLAQKGLTGASPTGCVKLAVSKRPHDTSDDVEASIHALPVTEGSGDGDESLSYSLIERHFTP